MKDVHKPLRSPLPTLLQHLLLGARFRFEIPLHDVLDQIVGGAGHVDGAGEGGEEGEEDGCDEEGGGCAG